MYSTHSIVIGKEKLVLINDRAVFWKKEKALIISDLHIGKSAHFRKNGISIPQNILHTDLTRLSILIESFQIDHVIINGDLLHAGNNSDVEKFRLWKMQYHNVKFTLIKGNHDKSVDTIQKINFHEVIPLLETCDFIIQHEFDSECEKFQITGHIHPGVVLKKGLKKMKLPCFALTSNQLLLPAFSLFTGLDVINTPRNAQYFVWTQEKIYAF